MDQKPGTVFERLELVRRAERLLSEGAAGADAMEEYQAVLRGFLAQMIASPAAGDPLHPQIPRDQLFDQSINSIKDVIMITEASPLAEPGPRIVYVNKAFEEHTGYTVSEVLGRSPRFLQGKETDKSVLQQIRNSLAAGVGGHFELRNLSKTGSWYWTELDISPVRNERGELTHFISVQRDITAAKKMQNDLEWSRQRFRRIAEVSSDVIYEWEIEKDIITWFGPTAHLPVFREMGEKCPVATWVRFIHPDDLERVSGVLESSLAAGSSYNVEYRVLTPDGQIRHWNDRGEVMGDDIDFPRIMVGSISDVTDIKRKDMENERLAQRLSTTFESISDALMTFDRDWRFTFVNSSLLRTVGKTKEELLGRSFWECFPDVVGSIFEQHYREAIATNEPRHFEAFYPANGCWYDLRSYPSSEGLAVYFRDITERRLASDALRASEQRLRHFVDSDILGVVVGDIYGGIRQINDYLLRVLGYTRLDFEELKLRWDLLTPRESDATEQRAMEMLKREGRTEPYEKEMLHRDGHRIPFLVGATLVDKNPNEMMCFAIDISDRKAAIDALNRINEELEIKVQERTRTIQLFSSRQAALARLELSINQPLELQQVLDAIVNSVGKELAASAGACVLLWDAGASSFSMAASTARLREGVTLSGAIKANRGASRWIVDNRKPLVVPEISQEKLRENPLLGNFELNAFIGVPLQAQGKVLGVLYVLDTEPRSYTDEEVEFLESMAQRVAVVISKVRLSEDLRRTNKRLELEVEERQRIHEALALAMHHADTALKEAEAANRQKSEFLSRMSHELRTPLNAILGFAQLLEISVADPDAQEGVSQILRGGRHLLNLINEVLDISRIETGSLSVNLQSVNFHKVIQQNIALIQPQAQKQNIQILYDPQDFALTRVWVDSKRLHQVLLNILSNAIKYNRPDGLVEIVLKHPLGEQPRVVIRDTGIGIQHEKMSRLFTPFDRLGADSLGIEGAGLGLALTKRFVELMHGTLEIKSATNQGTEVTISFPEAIEGAEKSSSEPIVQHYPLTRVRNLNRKILYIEDNIPNLELVRRILAPFGTEPFYAAPTGAEGIRLAKEVIPDLILLDLNLPDMSGVQVLDELKKEPELTKVPIVIITADANPEHQPRLLELGAVDFITKPFSIPHFLAVLSRLLD